MYKKISSYLAGVLIVLLLFASCNKKAKPKDNMDSSQQSSSETQNNTNYSTEYASNKKTDDNTIYRIYLNEYEQWLIDGNGKNIYEGSHFFDALKDNITGEIIYYCETKYLPSDEENETQSITAQSRLYDKDLNLISDWEDKSYTSAFGEYIIRKDYVDWFSSTDPFSDKYESSLYHVPTKQESYLGTETIQFMDESMLLCDIYGSPVAIIDFDGNKVAEIPQNETYYNCYTLNNHIIASNTNSMDIDKDPKNIENYILNTDFEKLYTSNMFFPTSSNSNDFFICQGKEVNEIFDINNGIIMSTESSINYFDGEIAILQDNNKSDYKTSITLNKSDGTVLAGFFSYLIPIITDEIETKAQKFIGVQEENIVLVDRDGNIIDSKTIPNIDYIFQSDGNLYSYYVNQDNNPSSCGIIDSDLNIIIEANEYSGIYPIYDSFLYETYSDDSVKTLYQGMKEYKSGDFYSILRSDIMDINGNIIMDNVSEVYGMGPDRIGVRRGYDIGLIDWDGNWIVKRSVFNTFIDD